MAAPPPKRFHWDVSKVVTDAQSIAFPWTSAVPPKIREWIIMYAKSHNTAAEYVFIGALVTTAAIMGPKSFVKVRETYQEPTNLYAISVGFPGSGKSQAYRMTVSEPLQQLGSPLETMLVDDYTKRGLFKHLQSHEGRALVAHEEMGAFFDLVQKRQLEGNGERQLYCRLYDGGQWVTSTGLKKSEGRQETTHNCVCIHGYVQPLPFLERIYPQLTESDDGFVDRLLVSFPKTTILLEKDLDDWCSKLQSSPMTTLVKPFRMIAEWHCKDEHVYSFDDKGIEVYRLFADTMARVMNEQWENGVVSQGNLSKDKRTMIRLCGILHIFYEAMSHCLQTTDVALNDPTPPSPCSDLPLCSPPHDLEELDELSPGSDVSSVPLPQDKTICSPSNTICEEEANMAVAITEYFQQQRSVYEQVRFTSKGPSKETSASDRSLTSWILCTKGAFCTPRSVTRSVTSRIKPNSEEIIECMKELAENGLGTFRGDGKEKVFYKTLPTEENKELITKLFNFDAYTNTFKQSIEHMTYTQIKRLLQQSPDKDRLVNDYGYEL